MVDRVGQQLGNYRLVRLLGKGGFAQVYLGEHLYLKTQAAIKVLQFELGNEERDAFLEEARTIAHLVHPHIVRVLDFGVEGNTPFLVMDYAPNGTLRQYHPKGSKLPLETIVSYVVQVASALQYAHNEHVIHRDVKPGNMLMSRESKVLLSDFGIALISHNTESQITEQDVIGSVAYMAPEQINGRPRPASDQYALGIVVYEWLCGERPFRGSFTEIVSQQMMAPPPSLRAKVPELSPDVEEAVMVALSKDPKERFASVQAFAHALEQAPGSLPQQREVPQPQERVASTLYPYTLKPITGAQAPKHPTMQGKPASPVNAPGPSEFTRVPTQQGLMLTPPTPFASPAPMQGQGVMIGQVRHRSRALASMVGVLAGIVLFSGCLLLAQYTSISTNVVLFSTITLAFVLSCLANVVLTFFGAVFGSLVGLLTGLVGIFVADYGGSYLLSAAQQAAIHDWHWYAGAALLGLFTGLISPGSRGRRKSTRVILVLDVLAAIGVDLGFVRLLHGNELVSAIALTVLILHLSLIGYNATRMRNLAAPTRQPGRKNARRRSGWA